VPTLVGNGLVVLMTYAANNFANMSDDGGGSNVYALGRVANNAGALLTIIEHCLNPSQSITTVTANFSASTQVNSIQVIEVVGALTADSGNTRTANLLTQTVTAFTTVSANTIVFCNARTSNSPTVPTGFVDLGGSGIFRHSYQVFTSVQSGLTPTWTVGLSSLYAASAEAYSSTYTGPSNWEPEMALKSVVIVPALPFSNPAPVLNATLLAGSAAGPAFDPSTIRRVGIDPAAYALPAVEPQKGDVRRPMLFGLTPSPLPPGPGKGNKTPFIRRLPAGTSEDDKRRSERVHDQLSSLLDSLIGKGIAVQLSPDEWELRPGCRVENRAPTSIDDATQGMQVGTLWINSIDKKRYICVDNTENAAVWQNF
jgi:hypothetical protein